MTALVDSPDWIADCMREYGRVLTGRFAHWCWEYDGLPIDENSPEFENCLCFRESKNDSSDSSQ